MPHDRDALRALVEKVRAAKGPDRELDAEIWWLFADHSQDDPSCAQDVARLGVPAAMDLWWGKPWRAADTFARVTDSLDAALALVRHVLPLWKLGTADADPTRTGLNCRAWAKVEPFLDNDVGWKIGAHEGFGATVPLAILAALLTALISIQEACDACD